KPSPRGTAEATALQAIDFKQRQIRRAIENDHDGVAARVDRLLADANNNRLDGRVVVRHLQQMRAALQDLRRVALPEIEQRLTGATKELKAVRDDDESGVLASSTQRISGSLE